MDNAPWNKYIYHEPILNLYDCSVNSLSLWIIILRCQFLIILNMDTFGALFMCF